MKPGSACGPGFGKDGMPRGWGVVPALQLAALTLLAALAAVCGAPTRSQGRGPPGLGALHKARCSMSLASAPPASTVAAARRRRRRMLQPLLSLSCFSACPALNGCMPTAKENQPWLLCLQASHRSRSRRMRC